MYHICMPKQLVVFFACLIFQKSFPQSKSSALVIFDVTNNYSYTYIFVTSARKTNITGVLS